MPEAGESNIEIAHKLQEGSEKKAPRSSRFKLEIEILEVIILALVAIRSRLQRLSSGTMGWTSGGALCRSQLGERKGQRTYDL